MSPQPDDKSPDAPIAAPRGWLRAIVVAGRPSSVPPPATVTIDCAYPAAALTIGLTPSQAARHARDHLGHAKTALRSRE